LPGNGVFTRGYNVGNVAARRYARGALPSVSQLESDLGRFLALYGAWIDARDGVNESTGEELPDGVSPGGGGEEVPVASACGAQSSLARQAKKYHGVTCTVCGFNFEEAYGPHGEGYIEAHHLVPFATLSARPDTVILDPKTDFTVVCANCHRMLHRKPMPSIDAFGAMLSAVPSTHEPVATSDSPG
jgi:5-methylcytosine-specific restriction protein A